MEIGELRKEREANGKRIDELKAEIARLRAAYEMARTTGCWCDDHGQPCRGCEEKQATEAELSTLRRDKAWLDWLETQPGDNLGLGRVLMKHLRYISTPQRVFRDAIDWDME